MILPRFLNYILVNVAVLLVKVWTVEDFICDTALIDGIWTHFTIVFDRLLIKVTLLVLTNKF